jgi:hypothetical protein
MTVFAAVNGCEGMPRVHSRTSATDYLEDEAGMRGGMTRRSGAVVLCAFGLGPQKPPR